MISTFVTFLFWPCMIASVVGSLIGVIGKSHRLLFVCAALIVPMSLYLATWPKFLVWGIGFPLCYWASAMCIKKGKRLLALAACMPVYAVIGWLGYVVHNQ